MNLTLAIQVLTEWVTANQLGRPRGQPIVRMDRELEEVRDYLLWKEKAQPQPIDIGKLRELVATCR